MKRIGQSPSNFGLEHNGIADTGDAHWNLAPDELCERALGGGEG